MPRKQEQNGESVNLCGRIFHGYYFTFDICFPNILASSLILFIYATGMFLLSWLPYAVCSVFQMISYTYRLGAFWSTLSAMYAKTFLIWTPLFYIMFNKNVKQILAEKFVTSQEKVPLLSRVQLRFRKLINSE